jgi:hypothetical protein
MSPTRGARRLPQEAHETASSKGGHGFGRDPGPRGRAAQPARDADSTLAARCSSSKMRELREGHFALLYKRQLSQPAENLHLDAAVLALPGLKESQPTGRQPSSAVRLARRLAWGLDLIVALGIVVATAGARLLPVVVGQR